MQNKLLVVEQHPLFAEALALCIRTAMPEADILQAGDLAEAKLALYEEKDFELILLDLSLPDASGLEGLIELRKLFPRVPVIIISALADQGVIRNAIVCGAAGVIAKSATKDAVLQVIADVLAGNVAGCLFAESGGKIETTTRYPEPLTHKQLCVLEMLCQGLLNKQIAYKLDVQTSTVKFHVTEILRKLSVGSRTQAVIQASKLNLVIGIGSYREKAAGNFPIPRRAGELLALAEA